MLSDSSDSSAPSLSSCPSTISSTASRSWKSIFPTPATSSADPRCRKIPMPRRRSNRRNSHASCVPASPSQPATGSYSLERFLQEPETQPPTIDPTTGRPLHPIPGETMQSPTPSGGGGGGPAGMHASFTQGPGRRPRLLLMGQRRSGKSSISSVVFHKMPPTETLFIESTTRIQKDPIHSSFMDFQVWDFPGQVDFFDENFDTDSIFNEVGAMIWVIDAQDEILDPLGKLHRTIMLIQQRYPTINIEVFIHKVDGLSEDYKMDTKNDIEHRTTDELGDQGYENVEITYHLTSIYDHSIFEAFSKVIQKLIPQLGTLENLLNVLCANSGIEKAFLFDVLSKIYVATDSSPVDVQSYEICSDFIDVIVDISEIYGHDRPAVADSSSSTQGALDSPTTDRSAPAEEREVSSVIRLQNGIVLYLREIDKFLALICLMRKESIEKQGLVDYNVGIFQQALKRVLEVGERDRPELGSASRTGSIGGGGGSMEMEYRR